MTCKPYLLLGPPRHKLAEGANGSPLAAKGLENARAVGVDVEL
jgi:hypothetical protein